MGGRALTVALAQRTGAGYAECTAPDPGTYQIAWGISEGIARGKLTITAKIPNQSASQ